MLWLRALPLAAKLGAGVVIIIAAFALYMGVQGGIKDKNERIEQGGVAKSEAAAATKGLSNVETANKAAADVRRDPVARDAGCLRHSRTPENC